MCGIIAFKSQEGLDVNSVIVDGLKRLEYRGYDSFGIAYPGKDGFNLIRKVGRIGDFSIEKTVSKIAMGHTRWATHGGVTVENAHPHLSNNNKIAVLHNGIIENYQELKDTLIEKGYFFRSETDTETVPNLIQEFMKEGNDFTEACRLAFNSIEGCFAIVAECNDTLVGARNGSPMVFGIDEKKENYFIGSDVTAFLEFTNKAVFLDDGDMVVLEKKPRFLRYSDGKEIKKEISVIDWSPEQASKGEYEHFMMKEIDEQKFTIRNAIAQEKGLIENVSKEINSASGIFFIGAGTSYHACIFASYVFSHVAKKHVNYVLASEFPNFEEFINEKTLVIAVSQSGETIDVLEAVKSARKRKAKVIGIVNVMGSTLTRLSDYTIMMNAGPEICVLSTKSYTSELAIIALLSYSAAGKAEEGKNLISKAAALVPEIIRENRESLHKLSEKLKEKRDIFLIGRNSFYPTALEGALKIKEVSYIHAEGFAGGELKHGTIALIEKGTPAIIFSDKGTRKQIISNAMEISARGGFIIGIDSVESKVFDYFIKIPDAGFVSPILSIIPIQILSYYLALLRNCDPDKPRNLAKSVTVK
ncbi:MAG: glutamine--fructose-6-phosphate transaminase (isomerizing) [Candidatus Woesearchaeota archaeon]|nr:glutamine--fructose-6-phosphate transaminase (isomerizing) [Candidatus Woesearchaeota archaeon]